MKTIIFITIVFFYFNNASSQTPGYLGRRFSFGLGVNTSPVTFGTSTSNKTLFFSEGSAQQGKLNYNFIAEAYLEYAFSNHWMVGASARRFKTAYDNRAFADNFNITPSGYYTITGTSFLPYFKKFKEDYLAPWGSYFIFGPSFNFITASFDSSIFVGSSGKIAMLDLGPNKSSRVNFDFLVGIGKTRVFADRFTLDYGVNLQLVALALKVRSLVSSEERISETKYIDVTSRERVRGVNTFNAYLRIGILW